MTEHRLPSGTAKECAGSSDAQFTIFLLDEIHDDTRVRDANIAIAHELLSAGNISVIGVENYSSRTDYYTGEKAHAAPHATAAVPLAHRCGNDTMFADVMAAKDVLVVGVDSEAWIIHIEEDGPQGDDIAKHIGQIERSKHFVRALLDERGDGDAILNCGSDHNEHIMQIARGRSPKPEWWPNARFVRLRCQEHPGGEFKVPPTDCASQKPML